MNETLKNIQSRFSCRSFLEKPVEEEKIHQIVEAAKYAPNGMNTQAWHFTVIHTPEGKQLLRDAAGRIPPKNFPQGKKMSPPGMPEMIMEWPFQGDFCKAPVIVMISGKPNVPWPDIGPILAAENLMIAATSLGLATLWSTVFTYELFRDEESRALKHNLIPEGYELKASIFVGYPEHIPAERPVRKGDNETWI